jgi:segregation and condensation protein B
VGELGAAIEAVLFVAEKPVSVSELAKATGAPRREVELALAALERDRATGGLRLQREGDQWRLITAPEAAAAVSAYLGADRLRISQAALETLSVIAYRQPVTRAQIEAIRGVNCDQTVDTLLQRRLIEEVGRAERPGRPILYGTTWEFLECFGLRSLEELPRVLTAEGERLDAPAAFAEPIV